MAGTWLVCAGAAAHGDAARTVAAMEPGASVLKVADPAMARSLARSMDPAVSVCVGDGCGMDPVNVAAALAADGFAKRTVLVAPGASGSLRSRAARAGVTEVVDPREGAGVVGVGAPSAEGGLCEGRQPSAPAPSPVVDRGPGVGGANGGCVARSQGASDESGASGDGAAGSGGGFGPDADNGNPAGVTADTTSANAGHPATGGREAVPAGGAAGPADNGAAPANAGDAPARSNPLAERVAARTLTEGVAPMVTLVSGRGGTGRSSIAAMCALAAAQWGMRVALVDLDLSFGNQFGFFGLAAPADLVPVAEGDLAERLASAGVPVAEGLDLYGPCGSPEYAEVVAPRVADILERLRHDHDLVVVDTSAAWGDAVAQAVQGADRVAIVGDERAGAIGSLARAASLAVRLGVARTRIVRVMNRCDARRRDEEFMTRATMGLEAARTFRVLEGTLDVAELLSAGHAAELAALDNDFPTSCAAFIAKLLADLGRLPDHEGARRARNAKVTRRRSVFSFAKAAG